MTENVQTDTDPIDHDGAFKELLHQCLELFLRLFYPQQAAQLDFSAFTFLEQERLTDYPSGAHRFVDTLVEMRTLSGQLIWIHIEFQSTRERGFPKRMFRYFSQFRLRTDVLIWQIVLYMPAGGGLDFETYTETLFEETFLPFRYWCLNLGDREASESLATENPVAYGLAPLMQRGEMSNPRLKAICLSGIAQSAITEAQAALLTYFVETYLPLTGAEAEEFEQLIQREEVNVMEFISSWQRQGRTEGRAEEARDVLLEQLQEKFDDLPDTAVRQVQAISSIEELRRLRRQLIHASSLQEMGIDGAGE